jgi:hypothetical protein
MSNSISRDQQTGISLSAFLKTPTDRITDTNRKKRSRPISHAYPFFLYDND